MTLRGTDLLRYIEGLKKIKRGEGFIDTDAIEANFLEFSSYISSGELLIRKPKTYDIKGEDRQKLDTALEYLKIKERPASIGITGAFNGCPDDLMLLLSLNQLNADYMTHERAYLNPLVEKIYTEGAKLINDFSIHEALFGRIKTKRDGLDLLDINLFPEKFVPGPYELSVEFNTSRNTILEFMEIKRLLLDYDNPEKVKKSILDSKKTLDLARRTVELRRVLGSLSRYGSPQTARFSAATETCLVKSYDSDTHFYFYSAEQNKNLMVYFDKNPFEKEPRDLILIDGNSQEQALRRLIEYDIFRPGVAVLEKKIKDMAALYEQASKAAKKILAGAYSDFDRLLDKLTSVKSTLQDIANEESKKKFVLDQPSEILEFMVCPKNDDPVIHDLLPHISWNNNLREYHNNEKFRRDYLGSDKQRKKLKLSRLMSTLCFTNQQNEDINLWLYNNFREECENFGVRFKVINE